MQKSKRLRKLVLAGALGALLFSANLSCGVQAGDCAAFFQGPNCIFDGIRNVPLGKAILSLNANCQLVAGNITGSGRDGVVQDQLTSVYMRTTLATPNFSGSMAGTRAFIRQLGIVDGVPNFEIMASRMINYNRTHVRFDVHCSYIKAKSYTLAAYNQGQLTGFLRLADRPVLTFPKADMVAMACGIWPNGDSFTEVDLAVAVPMMLQGPPGKPPIGPITGDVLFIAALSPEKIPSQQTAI